MTLVTCDKGKMSTVFHGRIYIYFALYIYIYTFLAVSSHYVDWFSNMILNLSLNSLKLLSRSKHIEWSFRNLRFITWVSLSCWWWKVNWKGVYTCIHVLPNEFLFKSSSYVLGTALVTVLPMVHWNCFIIHRVFIYTAAWIISVNRA